MADLERRIDDLYKGPLHTFVVSRSALAKELKGDDARRVRSLPKPTVVPWAMNQLYWYRRTAYDKLLRAGAKRRAAEVAALGGRSADVTPVAHAHRQAVTEAARTAADLAAASGTRVDREELARVLEAVSLAVDLAEPHGRFTRALQPAGFEALAGVAVRVPAAPPAAATPAPRDDRHAARVRAAAAQARAAEVQRAEAAVAAARADESQARSAWETAKRNVIEAERALETLRRDERV